MEALYDRIIGNEIKMKDDPIEAVGAPGAQPQAAQVRWAAGGGWAGRPAGWGAGWVGGCRLGRSLAGSASSWWVMGSGKNCSRSTLESGPASLAAQASAGWMDAIWNVFGRAKVASTEPTEESIRRTHDYLRRARRPPCSRPPASWASAHFLGLEQRAECCSRVLIVLTWQQAEPAACGCRMQGEGQGGDLL